jgi:hypothetical protein
MANPSRVVTPDQEEAIARFVLTEGEMLLQAQMQSAIASDQRASTAANFLTAVAVAVFAGGLALWDKLARDEFAAFMVNAGFLLLGAIAAAWAARPIDFFFPGIRPEQWDGGTLDNLTEMLRGAAEEVQTAIDENEAFMAGNQTALRFSFALAIFGPVAGALVWLIL